MADQRSSGGARGSGYGLNWRLSILAVLAAAVLAVPFSARRAEATNPPADYTLTVSVSPAGSGTVSPTEGAYSSGSLVEVTATAAGGWRFSHWEGDWFGSDNPAEVIMNQDRNVTAIFVEQFTLTTSAPGGGGSVVANPDRNPATNPVNQYDDQSSVTLTPVPDSGYAFDYWLGDLSGSSKPETLVMDSDKSVEAYFGPGFNLYTSVAGSGSITPASDSFLSGTIVEVAATADEGWRFYQWSGALSGTTNPSTVTMDADKSVTAHFIQTYTLTTSVIGSGSVSPSGGTYDAGSGITLSPLPDPGFIFNHWEGDLSGNANPESIIMDDDKSVIAVLVPTAEFALLASSAAEGAGTVTVEVNLSAALGEPVTVPWAFEGTARDAYDYMMADVESLVFAPGETSKTISITMLDDALDEVDETIVMTLDTPTNAVLGAQTAHTFSIIDDDLPPTATFTVDATSVEESYGRVYMEVTLSEPSGRTVSIPFTSTGTASEEEDYIASDSPLTFAPGATSSSIIVSLSDDDIDEFSETVVVTLGQTSTATLGQYQTHTLIITDEDPVPTVSLGNDGSTTLTVPESVGTVYLPVTLSAISCKGLTIPYTITGTATDGTDYTITPSPLVYGPCQPSEAIELPVIDDDVHEPDETVIITLGTPSNGVIGSPASYEITIIDDDPPPTISFEPAPPTVTESDTTVPITVTLSHPSSEPVTVNYTITSSFSGSSGSSGGGSGTVTFPPGTTSQTISVSISNDGLDESPESLDISLSDPVGGGIAAGGETVTVVVEDDDPPPTVYFWLANSSIGEDGARADLEVILSQESGQEVTVNYAVQPTSTATGGGVDYTLVDGSVTFLRSETSKLISVTIHEDMVYEGDETVEVLLSGVVNATLGTPDLHVLTIAENDPPPVIEFAVESSSIGETAAVNDIVVTLSESCAVNIEAPLTVAGTALNGLDYTMAPVPVDFAPGETTHTIPVSVLEDLLDEDDETVILTLGTPPKGVLGTKTVHTMTILDDDPTPAVYFSAAGSTTDELAGTAVITIQLGAESGREVTAPYIVSGTAEEGSDFTIVPSPVIFGIGETSKDVPVTLLDDILNEAEETVVVTLDAPVNAVLGEPSTHVLTVADNEPVPTVSFTTDSSSSDESSGTVTLTAALSIQSGQTVTVDYDVSPGTTATGGGVDYTLAAGALTFTPGETTRSFDIAIVEDLVIEADETVVVALSSPLNANLATPVGHTATILDNDFALTAISADPAQGGIVLDPPGGVYNYGTSVSVIADPAPGYALNYWAGDLTGTTTPGTVVMDADKTVTAYFGPGSMLTTSVEGIGSIHPPSGPYLTSSSVILTATPGAGWRLDHWEGALSGNQNPASLLMDGDKSVTGHFIEVCVITVVNPIAEAGTVTLDPPPGDDGAIPLNTDLALTATADSYLDTLGYEYEFDYWQGLPEEDFPSGPGGPGTSADNPVVYNIKGPREVGPVWKKKYKLTTAVIGQGSVNPGGGAKYENSTVLMEAKVGAGNPWGFDHWEGDLSGDTNPENLYMDGPKHVIGVFTKWVECSLPSSSVDESVGTTTVTITVPATNDTATIPYTLMGTALEGVDYSVIPSFRIRAWIKAKHEFLPCYTGEN